MKDVAMDLAHEYLILSYQRCFGNLPGVSITCSY